MEKKQRKHGIKLWFISKSMPTKDKHVQYLCGNSIPVIAGHRLAFLFAQSCWLSNKLSTLNEDDKNSHTIGRYIYIISVNKLSLATSMRKMLTIYFWRLQYWMIYNANVKQKQWSMMKWVKFILFISFSSQSKQICSMRVTKNQE